MFKRIICFLFVIMSCFTLASCKCSKCNKECEHKWVEATCTTPKTCSECEKTEGEALGHNWIDATYEAPKTCDRCGLTEGEPLENPNPSIKDEFDCITIAEAIALAQEAGNKGTDQKYYVYGVVENIESYVYGSMTIKDETGSLYVYGVFSKDEQTRYDALEEKPVVGDEVVLYGILKTYSDTPEMDRGYLQAMKHVEQEIDITDYKESTVLNARGEEAGSLLKLTGVVAKITYAFGYAPNGFYLVDNTSSIYVYGTDAAGLVKEGNTVTIIGEKTYYIAENEASNANKHGYTGCCQIQNSQIISNDNQVTEFDKSWITESTVKELMETPLSNNITTNIYKVNAIINKVENPGFTNYYINDLDNVTGSYVYTANSGSDFTWLDQYDGQICTVYLSIINAKSTATGCIYRLIPVAVSNDSFVFDQNNGAQFALDYYAKDQFISEYQSDPALELLTTVSNEYINLAGVALSYASSDDNVVYFETTETGVVMHTLNEGVATITITANHNGVTKSTEVEITVSKPAEYDTITVADAIASADGTEVYLKGVVMSSLVNQSGFYLNDGTGMIAVVGNADDIALLSVGDEVIIKGIKSHKIKDGYTGCGQINVYDAEILVNNYGNHEYSTEFFDTTKTLVDVYNFNVNEDHSTEVYVVNAIVEVVETPYYTNIKLKSLDGSVSLTLYSSSANQYSFLKAFAGQEVTVELAPCNWNSKNYYAGCVISVTYNGEKTVNTLNFNE